VAWRGRVSAHLGVQAARVAVNDPATAGDTVAFIGSTLSAVRLTGRSGIYRAPTGYPG
jgi:hypothetical protein